MGAISPSISAPLGSEGDVSILGNFTSIDENSALIANRWGWDSSTSNSLKSVTSFEQGLEESSPVFQHVETESYLINEAVEDEYYRLLSVENRNDLNMGLKKKRVIFFRNDV